MFNCISTTNHVRTFATRDEALTFVMREGDQSRLWSLDQAMTPNQIAWAASHDWFGHDNRNGSITVYDRYTQGGEFFEDKIVFSDIRKLRDWAGY